MHITLEKELKKSGDVNLQSDQLLTCFVEFFSPEFAGGVDGASTLSTSVSLSF
jgi:hypothetical protein